VKSEAKGARTCETPSFRQHFSTVGVNTGAPAGTTVSMLEVAATNGKADLRKSKSKIWPLNSRKEDDVFVQTCTRMTDGVVRGLMILIAMMLFTSACQPAVTTFRPPNLNELQAFIKDQDVTPVMDTLLDDYSTALLYENGTSFGYYTLTVQEPEGELVSNHVSAPKSDQPILIIGQLTGDRPLIAVVIQEAALAAETTAIEVSIDSQNRLTATTNGQVGAILVSPSPVNEWRTVTLYNAQGQVLYSQEGQP
jgi:hypothetical protein